MDGNKASLYALASIVFFSDKGARYIQTAVLRILIPCLKLFLNTTILQYQKRSALRDIGT